MADFSQHRTRTAKLVKKVGSRAADLHTSSSKHVRKYVTRRAGRIAGVGRFVSGWLLLVLLLCIGTLGTLLQVRSSSQTIAPTNGGTYTEGLVGEMTNMNPLFSGGTLDDTAGRLLYNGLLRYDEEGRLVGDVASEWRVDESKKVYTITLRRDVRWHDGQPLTAKDVVYTITTIQNPATRSTLFASWQGVKVAAIDDATVQFELPAPFAPFLGALTVPILPQHLLKDVSASKIRTSNFSNNPVGSGPFMFKALRSEPDQRQQIEFVRNEAYHRGAPKIERFVMQLYPDDESLAEALRHREITAAVDLKPETTKAFREDASIRVVDIPLNSGVFAFFKNTSPLLEDASIRSALVQAIDRQAVLELFDARYAPLKTPLLPSQLGYGSQYNQVTNSTEAERILDAAGWQKQADGMRAKDGQPLEFSMITVNSAHYSALAGVLQKQWASIGVSIKSQLLTLEQLQQNGLTAHAYDILLYGVSIGYDPDVYAYWHSSQARSGGLNFSEWKSARADVSLEVARTRLEPVLRDARYKTFLDEWQKSAPAVALYQPRVNYAYHQNVQGFRLTPSNNASARLTNIEDWTVATITTNKTP